MRLTENQIEKKIDRVIKNNKNKIFNWVKARINCLEDAEELTQDILRQIFISVEKKYRNNEEIQNINLFIMAVARNVLNTHLRKNKRYDRDVFIEKVNKSKGLSRETMLKMKDHIVHFNYKQREAMMMYYIDQMPLKKIAEILNTNSAYVKQILHKSRLALKKIVKNVDDDFEYNYHPDYLRMTLSGECIDNADINRINESLSKQHICITCYKQPCTIEKIGEITKIPKAIIEYDLEWLVEKDFVKKKKNSYYTDFIIVDTEIKLLVMNIYMKHKKMFSDIIIERLSSCEKMIRSVGFIGSDMPWEKLLWFLIYTFADFIAVYTCYKKEDYNINLSLRADGGHYIPVGYHRVEPITELSKDYSKEYIKLLDWVSDGTYVYNHNGCALKWLGIKNRRSIFSNKVVFNNFIPDVMKYKNVLFKSIKPNFNIETLTEQEQLMFDVIINNGWLGISEKDGKVVPNFLVFKAEQRRQLIDIFEQICELIKPSIQEIYKDLCKMCKKTLPSNLQKYNEYAEFLSLLVNHAFTLGFAYCDGKIYKPKNNAEWSLLTLSMLITDDVHINDNKNYSILLRATDI